MKAKKLLFGFLMIGLLASSCYTEVLIEDDIVDAPIFNVGAALQSHDLWYVDINATRGSGEIPFMQRAFTVSFLNGNLYANNNIVGIGKTGNGLGIDVGYYNPLRGAVEIDHDIDGRWILEVYEVNARTLELYHAGTDTSYFVKGFQANNFDYDLLFYDNIQYFMQEYDAWEKVYTSEEGAINDFDDENFLQFFNEGTQNIFRSSIDRTGTSVNNLRWDYEGNYQVYDIENDETLKTLTLDYDFMGNDYFELYVINDSTIELYHPSSETTYEFKGRGYQQYLKSGKSSEVRKRTKTKNPVMNVKRSRKK